MTSSLDKARQAAAQVGGESTTYAEDAQAHAAVAQAEALDRIATAVERLRADFATYITEVHNLPAD